MKTRFAVLTFLALVLASLLIAPSVGAAPAAGTGTGTFHIVQRGETLWRISQRYGVTVDDIVAANQLPDRNRIYAGQRLFIPPPRSGVSSTRHVYTVQRGDTLYSLSRRFGVPVWSIVQANGLRNPNLILAGQQLVIVRNGTAPVGASGPDAAPTPPPAPTPSPSPLPEGRLSDGTVLIERLAAVRRAQGEREYAPSGPFDPAEIVALSLRVTNRGTVPTGISSGLDAYQLDERRQRVEWIALRVYVRVELSGLDPGVNEVLLEVSVPSGCVGWSLVISDPSIGARPAIISLD